MEYEHERPLTIQGITIHPDFYVPEADAYIEDWGDIDAAYNASRDAKRLLYRGLRLIETHEEDMADLALVENHLREQLTPLLKAKPTTPSLQDLETRFEEYRPAGDRRSKRPRPRGLG